MPDNLLENLNDEQLAAVTHTDGPLMIVAGAGTGKTTVITHRIAWLIEQNHAKPENILALTFTDKAAGEMEERVDRLLPIGYVDLQISTFHSFCEQLLRDYGAAFGLSTQFRVVDELDAWLLSCQYLDRFELDYYRPLGNPTKYIKSLLTHFSRLKDLAITPSMYLDYAEQKKADADTLGGSQEQLGEVARLQELAHAYHTYQQILLEQDVLDFGDLIVYSLELLKTRPPVLKEVRKRFTHILVDEFQDTNRAQYELVKQIAAPLNNLTVVGDDDQSIYRFRGASVQNILDFQVDYPDTKRVVLNTNYRSHQEILDLAYTFIQANNPHRLEATDTTLSKQLHAHKSTGATIEHLHCETVEDEAHTAVEKITQLLTQFPDLSFADIGILVRSNAAADVFVDAFERQGIPYRFHALSGLYTKPVILDLLAYLRVIDDPDDSPSCYRVLTNPIMDLSAETIITLNQIARQKGKSLFWICANVRACTNDFEHEVFVRIETFVNQVSAWRRLATHKRVSELFILVTKESGYLAYLTKLDEAKKIDAYSLLNQFYGRLKQFCIRQEHPVLHLFLEEFSRERTAGEEGSLSVDLESGPDVVNIMTIHASKGLEFPYVFVANMVAQRFPSRAKREAIEVPKELSQHTQETNDAHLQEERRLFYVAVTRAKTGLFFLSANDYGGARKRKLSPFLLDLGFSSEQKKISADPFTENLATLPDPKASLALYLPKQFSFTQLAAFNTCPLQYKFAHVFKVPVFGKWTFSFGKTMHNTLHEFFKRWMEKAACVQTTLFETESQKEPLLTLDELLKIYEDSWQDDWYLDDAQREKYRVSGRESLKGYYAQLKNQPPTIYALEQAFTIKWRDIVLKGRIDRMDEIDGGVEIIDYKTGSSKTKKTLAKEDKEQLLLYQIAARDILGVTPKKLTYHYLSDNTQMSFLGTEKELFDLQDSVLERVDRIRTSDFEATPGFHCQFCDFSDICEFRE